MLSSMTGFGRAQREVGGKLITIEIKSVNHRFFEPNIRTPRGMGFLELPVKNRLARDIRRGKAEIFIAVEYPAGEDIDVSYNRQYLNGWLQAHGVPGEISLSDVAKNHDVFVVKKAEPAEQELTDQVLSVLEEALAAFLAARRREAEGLTRDILARLDAIEAQVQAIRARSPETVAEYRGKLRARMQEVLAESLIDEGRILAEAAVYADKVSVTEETTRLSTHIANFRELMQGDSPVGKKLDFYMQEMNREINTVGSKCNDVPLSRIVIEVKSELESIREQIQNIE